MLDDEAGTTKLGRRCWDDDCRDDDAATTIAGTTIARTATMSNVKRNNLAPRHMPNTMTAEVIDSELASLLRDRDRSRATGVVHSVFRRVINLWSDPMLFTVAADTLDPAPRTMLVNQSGFARWHVSTGALVRFATDTLEIVDSRPHRAPISVNWSTARPWNTDLPAFDIRGQDAAASSSALLRDMARSRQSELRRSQPASSTLDTLVNETMRLHADGLSTALAADQEPVVRIHAAGLVGLGQGLTPSGDDFLAGLSAVCAMRGSGLQHATAALSEVIDERRSATGQISYAMLELAVRGKVRESIRQLLAAVGSGNPHEIRQAALPVLQIGMSSGADLVSGIAEALQAMSLQASNGPRRRDRADRANQLRDSPTQTESGGGSQRQLPPS